MGQLIYMERKGCESSINIFMTMILTSVTMVGWADVPDSDQGDFRRLRAIDISSNFSSRMNFIIKKKKDWQSSINFFPLGDIMLIKSSRFTGVSLRFCTNSYIATGRRLLFTWWHLNNFSYLFYFWQDRWPWCINYLFRFGHDLDLEISKVKHWMCCISGEKNGPIAMKQNTNIYWLNARPQRCWIFSFDLDLGLECSRSILNLGIWEFAIFQEETAKLARNEQQTYRLNARPQM